MTCSLSVSIGSPHRSWCLRRVRATSRRFSRQRQHGDPHRWRLMSSVRYARANSTARAATHQANLANHRRPRQLPAALVVGNVRIDRFLDLADLRRHLAPFYSHTGRPSVDPELMVRMLLVGYCSGIRSDRRLCEEVHLNLAYRWFCRLGFEDKVPDHSSFSKNRQGRFRESDVFRHVSAEPAGRSALHHRKATPTAGPSRLTLLIVLPDLKS